MIADSDFGKSFTATEAVFEGNAEFRHVQFPGDDPMQGALFASSPVLIDTILPRPPTVMSDEGTGDEEGDEGNDDEEGGERPQDGRP